MSLSLEFKPHSWYKEFAIKDDRDMQHYPTYQTNLPWYAVTADGNTGYLVEFEADTIKELKTKITEYRTRMAERNAYNRRMIGE